MKLVDIDVIPVEIPLAETMSGSTYSVPSRCTVVTRLKTDGGLVSEVFNGDNRADGVEICRIIREELWSVVKGASIMDSEKIWQDMFALTPKRRNYGLMMEAIACVDTAIWDLRGKAMGVSVSKLAGGVRERMPIISIGGYYVEGRGEDWIREEMAFLKSAGMAGVKFKVGGLSPEEDAKRVALARQAAGADFVIGCDANRGWNVEQAIRFADLVSDLDIAWFEEPCHWYDDVRFMAEVRAAIRIPVCAGQSEITAAAVRRLLENGAVDWVNFDMSHGGGPTEWRRAAAASALFGAKLMHHEETHLTAHLLAAAPNSTYVECFADPKRDPIWDKMWVNRPVPKAGYIDVPTGPGFDIVLDQDMIDANRLDA